MEEAPGNPGAPMRAVVQDMSVGLSRDGCPQKKAPGPLEPERRWTRPSPPCALDTALRIYIFLFLLEKQRAHLPDHIPPPGNRNESGCCLSPPVFIASLSFYAGLSVCYHTLHKSKSTPSFYFVPQNHSLHFPKAGSSEIPGACHSGAGGSIPVHAY